MTTRRVTSMSVPHEYRDQEQQELDAAHRRSVVLSSLVYAETQPNVSEVFFGLVDELDLWDDVVDILRKRQRPGDLARIQLVEDHRRAHQAGGESGGTSVTT